MNSFSPLEFYKVIFLFLAISIAFVASYPATAGISSQLEPPAAASVNANSESVEAPASTEEDWDMELPVDDNFHTIGHGKREAELLDTAETFWWPSKRYFPIFSPSTWGRAFRRWRPASSMYY